jgi:hypothetical protein
MHWRHGLRQRWALSSIANGPCEGSHLLGEVRIGGHCRRVKRVPELLAKYQAQPAFCLVALLEFKRYQVHLILQNAFQEACSEFHI